MTKTSSSKGVSFDPRCAVFYSFGTLVEVAELAGQFAAEEMASFCSSLEPVSMAAVHMVENSPLCALSYFNRYCGAGRSCYSEFLDCQIASGLFRLRWPTPGSGVASWTDDLTVAEKWFGWPPGGGAFGRGARTLKQLKVVCTRLYDRAFGLLMKGDGRPLIGDRTASAWWRAPMSRAKGKQRQGPRKTRRKCFWCASPPRGIGIRCFG